MNTRIIAALVHAKADRNILILGGRSDNHFFCACPQMCPRRLGISETPARLDDDIDAQIAPWQRRRVFLGKRGKLHRALFVIFIEVCYLHRILGDADLALERAIRAIVAEQVRKRRVIGQIVDRHHL